MIDYRVLGRLEVVRDGTPIDLGAFRQRALLALLLTRAGTVVSTDRIIEDLWGATSGSDKQNSLWVYVSGLRTALEPQRAKRSEGTVLLTRPPGYVLSVPPLDTDIGRFEQAVDDARRLIDSDPAGVERTLRAALATWRGHAYEEFTYESWAEAEIARLEELRLEATELRIDADLRLGLAREVVSELHGLVRLHPLRERLVRSLMLALYRSGRTAEALRAASSLRHRLVDELGVEPSLALRELEHQILVDDGSLLTNGHATAAGGRPRSGLTVRGYELREELGRGAFGTVFRAYQPIVGREVAIKVIAAELADDPAFIRRFEAEAQLVAGLEHPHIIPLYDYWREPGAAYLVMRLVGGGTLGDVLAGGALTPARAATVFAQLAGALSAAHRSGVVHGDVKPENILIDGDGNAYLSDFGVAVALGADAEVADGDTSVTVPYVPPERLAGRPIGPRSDVYGLAVVAGTALTGLAGEYEQVRGALTSTVRTVLDRATATDPARRYPDATAFGRALTDALGEPAVPVFDRADIENPYKGLRAFGAADAGEFFGRERLVARLVARLGTPGIRGRFVAVVGPSGSGKSSVVRAGLLPALAEGALPLSAEWFRIELTPAPHPFEELESALVRIAADAPNDLMEMLFSAGGVCRAVHRLLPDDQSQLLLVIDQFEELYTQVDDATATRFIDELVDLVTASGTRVHVVITLRADFYDRPLRHRRLGELLRDGTEVITPMSVEELEAAITGPAASVGVEVDAAVVAEMVGDVVDRPGALPLLQYTMTELFDSRDGRTITSAAYRAGGGVTRMLARRADSLLAGLGADGVETARQVFLRLIAYDDEGGAASRRRALVGELEELERRGTVQRVLDTFGRHRLLSFDRDPVTRGPTVEISHEALLSEWSMLRGWLEDARDDLRTHRHLVVEMNAWMAADRSADYLLRGGRLDAVAAWADSTTMELRVAERQYLDASLEAGAAEQRARDEGRRRTAEAERRAARRTRQLAAAALAIALVAVLAGFAWIQREDARDARGELASAQEAVRLANASATALTDDAQLSLLLAIEAVRATADRGYAVPEAIDATHWALQALGVQYDVAPDTPTAVRSGPRGVQGVWVLPVDELMDHAVASTRRAFTMAECDRYFAGDCPQPAPLRGVEYPTEVLGVDSAEYLGGIDAYAAALETPRPEVVVAAENLGLAGQYEVYQRNFDHVGDLYGFRVRLQEIPATLSPSQALAQGLDADVLVVEPNALPALAEAGRLLDVGAFVDERALLADYSEQLVSLTRVADDGSSSSDADPIRGVMIGADSKTVVWTHEPEFTDAGYTAPGDWGSFMALARTMVSDGRTPFCIGIESGDADGWPATDWVEAAVLRSTGPDFYERWIRHDVPFDHPAVVDAIRAVAEMVHTPGFLDTTPSAASTRPFADAWTTFLEDPDACMMMPMPSFMPAWTGVDESLPLGSFEFPSFGEAYEDMVVGGGNVAVPVSDRPEVRSLMTAIASPDWGVGAAGLVQDSTLPPNVRFDPATFENPALAGITSEIHDAIRADTFRFDASDAMPPAIGSGAFWDGMVRLFKEGTLDNLDELSHEIASDIEAEWNEIE
jgi:DNA-binding SARP family transcriptional activator/ABC-type glycerol-3-phosphate transport system substrate-binding protein